MDTKTFLENFGHIADAPNGIQKLRGMILDLALQGKLGTQDPKDEPASGLLEKILIKKESLIKEKRIRKTKEPVFTEDTPSHNIPSTWVWTNLYSIGEIGPRNDISDEEVAGFIPMPLISETYGVAVEHEPRIWKEIKSGFTHFAEGDVALAKITPCYQNGKSCVMRGLPNGVGAGTTELHIFRPIDGLVNPAYVLVYLKSPNFIQGGIPKMTGTAGQKRVTRDYFAGNHFPLPPLEEQKRIVAKVDQLMALCDQLETQQKQKAQTRVALNNAALDKLLTAENPDEFNHHWQRIANNFHHLYDNLENLTSLRSGILALAVRGKLISQKSSNQSGADLLKEIKTYRDKLVDSGTLKKYKWLSVNENVEQPPEGWVATYLGNCIELISGQHLKREEYNEAGDGIPYLTGPAEFGSKHPLPTRWTNERRSVALKGDILLTVKGSGIGKTNIIDIDEIFISRQLMAIRPLLIDRDYIYLILQDMADVFQEQKVGIAIPGISREDVIEREILLPPLEEQKRIVAKVDQLMALCDQLETKLKQTQTTSEKFVEAVVKTLAA